MKDAAVVVVSNQSIARLPVQRVGKRSTTSQAEEQEDALAIEEPLEIRLGFDRDNRRTHKSVSITMRTPGNDFELAAGFLFTEGIVKDANQIQSIHHCGAPAGKKMLRNVVRVELQSGVAVDLKRLERHFYTTSSCGVCGKTSIEALRVDRCAALLKGEPIFASSVIHTLPAVMRETQAVFDSTGGLHAAALFDRSGKLQSMREDVGRHNAVDKLIGAQMLRGRVPLHNCLLLVSGRASFELVQKAIVAGIPIMAAVGAPSSLAVELARERGMTLLGFVRDNRFNIYAGAERIKNENLESQLAVGSNAVRK